MQKGNEPRRESQPPGKLHEWIRQLVRYITCGRLDSPYAEERAEHQSATTPDLAAIPAHQEPKRAAMPCRPAISSHSLGRAWVHDMVSKLDQAANYGLDIELFHEDLQYMAEALPGGASRDNEIKAAHQLRRLCDDRDIDIICLQPFMHYEGLRDRQQHAERVDEFKTWIQLAHVLRTSIIAIPSSFLSRDEASGDLDTIVADLREVADLAAADHIRIAYESLAWGTYADLWEQSWDIVRAVDRPNFGLCLDTFNIAARIYADPAADSRKTPDADEVVAQSMRRLVDGVDVDKIFFIQVVDGEFLREPLRPGHELYDPEHCHVRMSWSRACRLFYGEQSRGAYLPIKQILQAILVDVGYRGHVSAELFNNSLAEPQASVPQDHAKRAYESWMKIVQDFGLEVDPREHPAKTASSYVPDQQPRAQL